MLDDKGDVLYVGKAKNLKRASRPTPSSSATRSASHGHLADRRHGVRAHGGARPRRSSSKPTSSSACARATTSFCATTKASPKFSCAEIMRFADLEAPRQPRDRGPLLRPVRFRRRRQPCAQHLAARVPPALVFRQRVRETARGRASSTRSNAARRRASATSMRRPMRASCPTRPNSRRQRDAGEGDAERAHGGGRRGARL